MELLESVAPHRLSPSGKEAVQRENALFPLLQRGVSTLKCRLTRTNPFLIGVRGDVTQTG